MNALATESASPARLDVVDTPPTRPHRSTALHAVDRRAALDASNRIVALDDLLPILARALDVRELFAQLSAIASRAIPHDEAHIALFTPDGEHLRLLASAPSQKAECLRPGEQCVPENLNAPRLVAPTGDGALRAGVCAPVRIGEELIGALGFFSKTPDLYDDGDLAPAQRVADYAAIVLSHQRLAEAARQAAVDRERAATLETMEDLLRTVADVLDIREVFPRISEIAAKMLPHDRLTMSFHDGNGNIVMEAASNDDGPTLDRIGRVDPSMLSDGSFRIFRDFASNDEDAGLATMAVDVRGRVLAAGYRSVLAVHLSARGQGLGVHFWSKQPEAFDSRDVPIARRIADHVALAVSHEQLAEAARQIAEARARAERLEIRVKSLSEELDSRTGYVRVVGQSEEWKAVLKQATQVADTETTVLLTGESGTGKEVVARFVHRASARRGGPFVALNCAALPEQLLESELFGYERGAFTGALAAKPGQIELAAGGVLFLDEVAEMSPSAQAKFLRVLQEREYQRLGGTRVQKANVRIIAATNRDLRKAMERGDFREDLYYRLGVFDIRLPPLRERTADLLPLSEAFLDEIGKSFGRPPAGMTRDARQALLDHHWPGNVRELRNALERAAILCEGGLIGREHLSLPHAPSSSSAPASTGTDLNQVEHEMIDRVLRESKGNKSKAARKLGLSRTQLYVRLRRYGLA
jgi:transcriptional regulator with GAF, ATPase, and Fis domain